MIEHSERSYGPDSRDRTAATAGPGPDGARAALETFYRALNGQDAALLRRVWATHPLAQLNNPVGGILRGGDAVAELYERIFAGTVGVRVTFGDVVEYAGPDHAVFAGRESGTYVDGGVTVPLQIRTTRYFRRDGEGWRQFHHHGSIDAPEALEAYQRAVRG